MNPYFERDGIAIYHGDCREILPTLTEPVDLVLTDPPYGISYATNYTVGGVGASWLNTVIENDTSTSARDWVVEWADATPMLVFGTWKQPPPLGTRGVLVWDKGPAFGMGDLSLPWKPSFELIYVIGQGFSGHRDEGVLKGFTNVSWESKGRCHPNEKPVSLLRYLISKTNAETIYDPFGGSGTTMRACMDLGRRGVMIEIEERYCEIAANRLSQQVLPLEGIA
jgi:DNA modification methylase